MHGESLAKPQGIESPGDTLVGEGEQRPRGELGGDW